MASESFLGSGVSNKLNPHNLQRASTRRNRHFAITRFCSLSVARQSAYVAQLGVLHYAQKKSSTVFAA